MGAVQNAQSGGQYGNASMDAGQAKDMISRVDIPSINQMKIKLADLVQQGVLTPEMAQTFLQQASAYEQMDPATRAAQMGALGDLQDVVSSDGMDPQARAALYELQSQGATQERGQREAILQNAAARGIGGSGLELGSQLANQQGSATSLANQGFQSAADANARKMAAIQGVGQLGGQVWGQDAQAAAAQNAINQFNTANRQSTENQNVGWRNQADAQNLAEKQRISDTNVGAKNQQELYNKGLYQQNFANQMSKSQAFSNAALGQAQNELEIGKAKSQGMNNVDAKWSDENLKTDIKEFDSGKFLDEMTGYKYKFKDDKHGKGDQVGVMAQDVEKGAPQAVETTAEGKKIDYSKLGGPVLASLASLNKRLDDLEGKK